jgi:hypothetical protein
MNMRHVTALGMISLALLVSLTHAAWAQEQATPLDATVQTAYSFPCTRAEQGLNQLCFSLSSESNRVTVVSMVNLCSSPSSFVLRSGRSQVTALTVPANQQTPASRIITVPAGWVLAIQTNPRGCTGGCRTVTSTIQFNEPPLFCRQSQ